MPSYETAALLYAAFMLALTTWVLALLLYILSGDVLGSGCVAGALGALALVWFWWVD